MRKILILFLLMAAVGFGDVYFDSEFVGDHDGTAAAPYDDLTDLADWSVLVSGDTVYLGMDSTFTAKTNASGMIYINGEIGITVDGSWDRIGSGTANAIIDASGEGPGNAAVCCFLIVNACSDITIENVQCEGSGGAAAYRVTQTGTGITFDTCVVLGNDTANTTNNHDGFSFATTGVITMADCSATDCKNPDTAAAAHQAITTHDTETLTVDTFTATTCDLFYGEGADGGQASTVTMSNITATSCNYGGIANGDDSSLTIIDSTIEEVGAGRLLQIAGTGANSFSRCAFITSGAGSWLFDTDTTTTTTFTRCYFGVSGTGAESDLNGGITFEKCFFQANSAAFGFYHKGAAGAGKTTINQCTIEVDDYGSGYFGLIGCIDGSMEVTNNTILRTATSTESFGVFYAGADRDGICKFNNNYINNCGEWDNTPLIYILAGSYPTQIYNNTFTMQGDTLAMTALIDSTSTAANKAQVYRNIFLGVIDVYESAGGEVYDIQDNLYFRGETDPESGLEGTGAIFANPLIHCYYGNPVYTDPSSPAHSSIGASKTIPPRVPGARIIGGRVN